MKKLTTLIFLISFGALVVNAQNNLVPNGSFEHHHSCPSFTGYVDSVVGWHTILNTPDYFDTCATHPAYKVPNTFAGFQSAFDGSSYVGLVTFFWAYHYREIIGTKLNDTLTIGKTYHCSMRVSKSNHTSMVNSNGASNNLGMRFSKTDYSLTPIAINNFAQVYTNTIITDTVNWVVLNWDFIADSAYSHIYIGNFFDDAHTDTIITRDTFQSDSYYFIDSVNVFCINCFSGINKGTKNSSQLVFDINSKKLLLQSSFYLNNQITVYNLIGQPVLQTYLSNNESIDLSRLNKGIYIVSLQSNEAILTKKIIIQ